MDIIQKFQNNLLVQCLNILWANILRVVDLEVQMNLMQKWLILENLQNKINRILKWDVYQDELLNDI